MVAVLFLRVRLHTYHALRRHGRVLMSRPRQKKCLDICNIKSGKVTYVTQELYQCYAGGLLVVYFVVFVFVVVVFLFVFFWFCFFFFFAFFFFVLFLFFVLCCFVLFCFIFCCCFFFCLFFCLFFFFFFFFFWGGVLNDCKSIIVLSIGNDDLKFGIKEKKTS